MSELNLRLTETGGTFEPGEDVHGTASWLLLEAPEELEVRLFWYTEGKGDMDVGIAHSKRLRSTEIQGSEEFKLTLPDGPLSFSGRLITLHWAVELVALPSEETFRQPIVVSHTGREILIDTPPAEPFPGT